MDMKRIDAALKVYREELGESDVARLDLFKGLWDLQNRHVQIVEDSMSYDVPEPSLSEEWYWQEKPFFLNAPVVIDPDLFVAALEDCSCYLVDNGGLPENVSENMRFFDWRGLVEKSDLKQAGYDPLAYIESCFVIVQESFDDALDSGMITLVLAYALRPMLEPAAQAIMKSLAPTLKEANLIHDKPLRCPACGGEASAAFVGETPSIDGNGRLLYCGVCGTSWEFERIRCGHCGTRNQTHLHYFNIEGDDAHRLHNCQECGDYMRTVFQEDATAPFSFEVEDVVMARLDMVANDSRFNDEMSKE